MNAISYTLDEAARALSVDESTLARLRDDGLVITYRIGRNEYVTDHMLRNLQHILEVGAEVCMKGER